MGIAEKREQDASQKLDGHDLLYEEVTGTLLSFIVPRMSSVNQNCCVRLGRTGQQ